MFELMMTWNCPHQGMPGTIVMIMPFFLFFFFFKYLLFFTGKLPRSGSESQWCGTIPTKACQAWSLPSCPYFFFLFSNSYCFFTGKQPLIRLVMMWNCPHQGMPGMIIMIVPFFFLYFILFYFEHWPFSFLLEENYPRLGLRWQGNVPTCEINAISPSPSLLYIQAKGLTLASRGWWGPLA